MEPLGPHLDGYHDPRQDLAAAVARRTVAATERAREELAGFTDAAGLARLQDHVRAAVEAGVGGPLPQVGTPVLVESRGAAELPPGTPYRVERLLLTTRPGVLVPANVYVPHGPPPASGRPAVVFLCGHEPGSKAEPDYQRVCGLFAAHGYVVASFDPYGQGERHGYDERVPPGTAEHTYAGLPCWWAGTSPARYFVDDARRVVDHLVQRGDVDAGRIVAVGASGGGTLTTLLMSLEPRLAGAAPATYVTSRLAYLPTGGRQDAEQILLGGTAAGIDHDWLLLAMAPRPVCVLAADSDFFPIEGTVASVAAARPAWEVCGAEEELALVRVDGGHRFGPELAERGVAFFDRALGNVSAAALDVADVPVVPAAELQCTTRGQVALEPGGSRFVHDLLVAELAAMRPEVDEPAARAWLRAAVRPHREEVPLQVRHLPVDGGWHVLWQSEPGIWGSGLLSGAERGPVERVVLLDQGTPELRGGPPDDVATLVLDVRGRGSLAPSDRDGRPAQDHRGETYKLLSDLLWLGDSLAAAQVWDVLRAVETFAPDGVELVGEGYGAYLARLAAFCEPRVHRLRLCDEYVDPDRAWQERYHDDDGRGAWHGIIPGLVVRAPWPVIRAATDRIVVGQ